MRCSPSQRECFLHPPGSLGQVVAMERCRIEVLGSGSRLQDIPSGRVLARASGLRRESYRGLDAERVGGEVCVSEDDGARARNLRRDRSSAFGPENTSS